MYLRYCVISNASLGVDIVSQSPYFDHVTITGSYYSNIRFSQLVGQLVIESNLHPVLSHVIEVL